MFHRAVRLRAVRSHRSSRGILCSWAALLLLSLTPLARAQDANMCDQPGETPDLVVGDIRGVTRFGNISGITAFGLGTDACNLGTCWLTWTGSNNQHPVIGQNIFRLKDGRFEQVGQSWLKHGFGADHAATCSPNCVVPPDYSHLGVNCSDLYDSAENGWQTDMGPKYDVNAFTGGFPFPATNMSQTGNAIFKRLQVHNSDLDPLLNPGALYFAEIQYISGEDAEAGNGYNNASYRRLAVNGANGAFGFTLTGATTRGEPATSAWKAADPYVQVTPVDVPGDGRLFIATRATFLGDGFWRYEYAVQNLNETQGVRLFSVPIPSGTTVRNAGFHDVDYHSGELEEGVDWHLVTNATSIYWAANLPQTGRSPNYLNWGTLYNFRFEADAGPGSHDVTLGLPAVGGAVSEVSPDASDTVPEVGIAADETGNPAPKPGGVLETLLTPDFCNGDGICSGTETCANCAADCVHGAQCCGNGTCEASETNANCHRDCASVLARTLTPSRCDGDAICGPGESCSSCPSDCEPQVGRCCGDGTCEPGETASNCFADCGTATSSETRCGDGVDDDRDGLTDCLDPDCCTDPACDAFDLDGDSRGVCDCNDSDGRSWATPGEALSIVVSLDPLGAAVLFWSSPSNEGGSRTMYDAVRSPSPSDFFSAAVCLPSPDPTYLLASDSESPAPGSVFYYLVRARNTCPSGMGTLGAGSDGVPRAGRTCP